MYPLRDLITVTPIVAPADENSEETLGTPVSQRARVTQLDGMRYMKNEELADRVIYKVETYANNFGNNFFITYNGVNLYPVRPATVNQDPASRRDMFSVIVAAKV
jgi:hypothetical protein